MVGFNLGIGKAAMVGPAKILASAGPSLQKDLRPVLKRRDFHFRGNSVITERGSAVTGRLPRSRFLRWILCDHEDDETNPLLDNSRAVS